MRHLVRLEAAPAPSAHDLPHPLTFFMTAGDRAKVLRTLRASGQDRSRALLRALEITPDGDAPRRAERRR